MKTIFFVIFLVFFSVGTGCKVNSGENTQLPVFDLGTTIGKQISDTFTWNSIAKRITYVPVSTSPDALFGSANLVHVGNDLYCMVDYKTNTIFRTDKNGKVINSFSRKGNGPGEYVMLTYVYVNSEDSTIRIFDQRGDKYIVYDLEGNLIQEIFLKDKGIGTPLLISDNYIVTKGREQEAYRLCITDKELNIRERLFFTDTTCTEIERMCLLWQINKCKNRDLAIINYANEDTVFAVNGNGMQPLCVFEKGKYKLPDTEAKKMAENTPQGSPFIRSMWLSSVPGYYLISYLFENRFYDEIWSKTDNQIVSRFSNENGEFGYPFRLPSGKKIRIHSNSLFINANIVGLFIPASIAAEEKIADVEDDDNPVLVVIEL